MHDSINNNVRKAKENRNWNLSCLPIVIENVFIYPHFNSDVVSVISCFLLVSRIFFLHHAMALSVWMIGQKKLKTNSLMNMKLSWFGFGWLWLCTATILLNNVKHVWKIAESVVKRICFNEKIYYIILIQQRIFAAIKHRKTINIFCFVANMKHELVADFPINNFAMKENCVLFISSECRLNEFQIPAK